MSITYNALCYLHAWENKLPIPTGLAFEPLLRRIKLDYSFDSLNRVDTFLDALRTAKKPGRDAFLDKPDQQGLLYLLAFYVGEVVGRSLGGAPLWLTHQECVEMDATNAAFGDCFESSVRCLFPGTASRLGFFGPLVAISSRLFSPQVEKSVHFSALSALPDAQPRNPSQAMAPVPLSPHSVKVLAAMEGMSFAERERLVLAPPPWIQNDPLEQLFKASIDLLKRGRVVWAAVVQANNDLFQPEGFAGAPAEVIYDPQGRVPAEMLHEIARKLFSLKGQQPADPQMARYAAHITGETSRAFGFAVPDAISPYPLKASTTWLQRDHLPGRRLSQACFPVLVNDDHPGLVLFLPAPFWPKHLLEAWD